MIKIVPITDKVQAAVVALKIYANMRTHDRAEMLLMGYDDLFYIKDSIDQSGECFAAYGSNNELLCVFGVVNRKNLGFGVPVWLVATEDVNKYHKELVKHGRTIIKSFVKRYKKLYNYISIENEPALRYIRAMGAELYPPQRWGINGELFVPFVIKE